MRRGGEVWALVVRFSTRLSDWVDAVTVLKVSSEGVGGVRGGCFGAMRGLSVLGELVGDGGQPGGWGLGGGSEDSVGSLGWRLIPGGLMAGRAAGWRSRPGWASIAAESDSEIWLMRSEVCLKMAASFSDRLRKQAAGSAILWVDIWLEGGAGLVGGGRPPGDGWAGGAENVGVLHWRHVPSLYAGRVSVLWWTPPGQR